MKTGACTQTKRTWDSSLPYGHTVLECYIQEELVDIRQQAEATSSQHIQE